MTVGEALRCAFNQAPQHPRSNLQTGRRLGQLRQRPQSLLHGLQEILELAKQVTTVERADDDGNLGSLSVLPDPNVGTLTQIFREYAPADAPVIIENVVIDIDTIVRQVRFTGWTQT